MSWTKTLLGRLGEEISMDKAAFCRSAHCGFESRRPDRAFFFIENLLRNVKFRNKTLRKH